MDPQSRDATVHLRSVYSRFLCARYRSEMLSWNAFHLSLPGLSSFDSRYGSSKICSPGLSITVSFLMSAIVGKWYVRLQHERPNICGLCTITLLLGLSAASHWKPYEIDARTNPYEFWKVFVLAQGWLTRQISPVNRWAISISGR